MRPGPLLLLLLTPRCAASDGDATALKAQVLVGYDKTVRPSAVFADGNASTCAARVDRVRVQMFVEALTFVDQKSRTFGLEGYFRAFWADARLAYNSTCVKQLAWRSAADVWTPDLYFEQSQKVALAAAGDGQFIKVAPNGDVSWSRQARLTLRCPMHFGTFPFDAHSCPFKVGLYSDTADEVQLAWVGDENDPHGEGGHVGAGAAEALSNWRQLRNAVWRITDMTQLDLQETYAGVGTYTYAQANLFIARRLDWFPCAQPVLLVFLSYLGFWINPAATPGRIALALITILVVFGQLNALHAKLPPLNYPVWRPGPLLARPSPLPVWRAPGLAPASPHAAGAAARRLVCLPTWQPAAA